AFVEPDEEQLKKKPWWQQIAILGAGSTSNLIFGALFLCIWVFAALPMTDASLSFNSVMNESSLNAYGVESGTLIGFDDVRGGNAIWEELQSAAPGENHTLLIEHENGT